MTGRRLLIVAVCASLAFAWFHVSGQAMQAGGGFELLWWTLDGGGGSSEGSRYLVRGVVGQADTGSMAGDRFAINGGYWDAPGATRRTLVYLPVAIRTEPSGAPP